MKNYNAYDALLSKRKSKSIKFALQVFREFYHKGYPLQVAMDIDDKAHYYWWYSISEDMFRKFFVYYKKHPHKAPLTLKGRHRCNVDFDKWRTCDAAMVYLDLLAALLVINPKHWKSYIGFIEAVDTFIAILLPDEEQGVFLPRLFAADTENFRRAVSKRNLIRQKLGLE